MGALDKGWLKKHSNFFFGLAKLKKKKKKNFRLGKRGNRMGGEQRRKRGQEWGYGEEEILRWKVFKSAGGKMSV